MPLCRFWPFILKELYRTAAFSANSECDDIDPSSVTLDDTCGFVCTDTQYDDIPGLLKSHLKQKDIDYTDYSDDDWKQWQDFVCGGNADKIFPGDHLESASASDPSFWPVHGTLERLLQAKYLVGGFPGDDFSWPSNSTSEDFACDKSKCYEKSHSDYVKDEYSDCCYGHYKDSQLLDFTSEGEDGTLYFGPTNSYVMEGTDPTSDDYNMPYIYDHFLWDHCVDEGYDINALLVSHYTLNNAR